MSDLSDLRFSTPTSGPDQILDVACTFDTLALARCADATREIYEISHATATEQARLHGKRLRHPDPRETVVKHAKDPLTGNDLLLVGTRWIAD